MRIRAALRCAMKIQVNSFLANALTGCDADAIVVWVTLKNSWRRRAWAVGAIELERKICH
jgi:hypothetical protein